MKKHPPLHLCAPSTLVLRGFGLIEILVSVAIGLIAMLAIFQTFATFGGRANTTNSGSDAQVSGTLGMFMLERDLRLAGLGFGRAQATVAGCTVSANDNGRVFTFPLVPVQIVANAVPGGPDTIRVLYGNSAFYSSEQAFTASAATAKTTINRAGFQMGDRAIVATPAAGSAGPCALVEITDNTHVDGLTVAHAQTTYNSFYTGVATAARFNPAGGAGSFTAGTMYSLGPEPRLNEWTVQGNRVLQVVDTLHSPTNAQEVAEGIVNLQAEYGLDTNNDAMVDSWTTADPTTDWLQIRAIRVAMLARSELWERTSVTTAAPQWTKGDGTQEAFVMTDLHATTDSNPANSPNNWRHYRYRVYEKVIPLRNMIWGTSP